jgi:hypothetical protein
MQKLHQPSRFSFIATYIPYPLLYTFLSFPFFIKAISASDPIQNWFMAVLPLEGSKRKGLKTRKTANGAIY